MALARQITCKECGERKLVASSSFVTPEICNDCRERHEAEEKEVYLQDLQAQSPEERMRRIEEWIYDHSGAPHGAERIVL